MLTRVWNDENEHSVKIEPTIKAVGILSKGIKQLMGEDTLKSYLERLMFVEMNTYRIVEEFGDLSDPDREVKRFKVILKKQKQLVSFLTSYSYFVSNMDSQPGERECQHFYDLSLTATRNFRKLYMKYRPQFLESLASLIISLNKHDSIFIHWIVRFVKQAVGDIITSHKGVTQEESEESLDDAVLLWQGLIDSTKELSEPTCVQIYDTLLNTVIGYITTVVTDISPNLIDELDKKEKLGESENIIANSNSFLSRLTDFLLLLIPKCQNQWFVRWYPNYVTLIQKLMITNKNPRLYQLMAVPLLAVDAKDILDKKNKQTYEIIQKWMIHTAVPKLNDFRGGLLNIKGDQRNQHLLLDFIEKLYDCMGNENDSSISKNELAQIKQSRLSIFSFLLANKDFNTVRDDNDENISKISTANKGRMIAIRKLKSAKANRDAKKRDREEIEVRILSILGRLGGISHQIVKDDESKENSQIGNTTDFVNVITDKNTGLKFNIFLENCGIQIDLQAILPKIIEQANNEPDNENTIAAMELINALRENIESCNQKDEENLDAINEEDQAPLRKL